jgi:hypothetical protein
VQQALNKIAPVAGESGVTSPSSDAASLDQRLDAIEAVMNAPLASAAAGEAGDGGTGARVFALQAGLVTRQGKLTAAGTRYLASEDPDLLLDAFKPW